MARNVWPRDRYTGPGGGLYTGPGGGMYTGPSGGAYTGPNGGMYTGPGGGMYTGPDGGLYKGPGGGLYTGLGGGLYTGPGGGLYTGPGGGLYTGPGGGLYTGPCENPYRSNLPPRNALLKYLAEYNMHVLLRLLQPTDPLHLPERRRMTTDGYLINILQREAVDTSLYSPVRNVQATLTPVIRQWATTQLSSISPSGSFAKGTANRSGTDIDLFVSLLSNTTNTLKEIYESLFSWMQSAGYSPKKQNVSINIKVNGYDVDLVPAKKQDTNSDDHSLYRRRADTWTKTNVQKHISYVALGRRTAETRILKLWRNQHNIDFPSFYLELVVIAALHGKNMGLSSNVWAVFTYLRDSFLNARFVDPANTNNIISEDLSASGKDRVRAAAIRALSAKNWNEIVV